MPISSADSTLRAAVLCRYPIEASGVQTESKYIYFIALDIDIAASPEGGNLITDCETIEILAIV